MTIKWFAFSFRVTHPTRRRVVPNLVTPTTPGGQVTEVFSSYTSCYWCRPQSRLAIFGTFNSQSASVEYWIGLSKLLAHSTNGLSHRQFSRGILCSTIHRDILHHCWGALWCSYNFFLFLVLFLYNNNHKPTRNSFLFFIPCRSSGTTHKITNCLPSFCGYYRRLTRDCRRFLPSRTMCTMKWENLLSSRLHTYYWRGL